MSVAPNWRATATVGTAFRVPTLYQRFSDYGDASLQPEQSQNTDLGLRCAQGADSFSATVYRTNVTNLINWVGSTGTCAGNNGPSGGCYANVGKARLEGITLAGTTKRGMFNLHGSVDFQNPRDQATDKLLARRAKRHLSLDLDRRLGDFNVGATWQAYSQRYDDVANNREIAGYGVLDLRGSWQASKELAFDLKLANLLDKGYSTALYQYAGDYRYYGYQETPRSLMLGLTWTPAL